MKIIVKKTILLVFGLFNILKVNCGDIELGRVKWLRDLDQARISSASSNKDILILFQEIPGCSTCKNYGKNVLSHPLIVEAIEDLFIPVVVHNNKQGKDKEILDFFGEPSWNNPVIRIVDNNLKDISKRLNGDYTSYGLISKINAALLIRNKKIPDYCQLLEEELLAEASGIESTYIGMYCFWSGEKCYTQAPGVIATKAGFMKGSEVVEIKYNPKKTNLSAIVNHGKAMNCADRIFINDVQQSINIEKSAKGEFRADKESKYYLFNSKYKYIPMTELQACKTNLAISNNQNPAVFLSPRQIHMYNKIVSKENADLKNAIGIPMEEIWYHAFSKN
ncbi:MAG: hypothetical protein HOP11_06745 [Saprospiraceae bacterium]|nr:hypothetical protein [Saprospiraceae bacterium]